MIRVLHLIKSLGRGGAEMLLPETLKLHDRQQFEFHYIYFLPWKNQMVEPIRAAGGSINCFSASNNIAILFQCRRVIRYVRENNIQLIHCHLPWAGFLGRLVHRITGVPVVYSEHNKQERYHGLTAQLNKITFNWQTQVIAVSDDVSASIEKHIHPRIPVRTILNGVNAETFKRSVKDGEQCRRENGLPPDAFVIGTVAVFRFQKRLSEWLEVMAVICKSNPNVFGILVGDGPLKDDLYRKRADLGLSERVIMPGLQQEVRPWLSAMDVYMMTSVFEGLPIALLEAMSMECAIISKNAGGIKEVVRDGLDGLTVDVDQWDTLPQSISRLSDQQLLLKLKSNARQRVVEQFSMQRMVSELEDVYRTFAAK